MSFSCFRGSVLDLVTGGPEGRQPRLVDDPSMTIGVASNCVRKPVVTAVWKFHCAESCATFAGVICLSGLWR
jgi:hypothetical protein